MREEGVYLIKRVDFLPKRGNANYLYMIKSESPVTRFHRWNYGKYEEIPIFSSIKKTGVLDYNDLLTSTSPIGITGGGGFTLLTNDGLGEFTNKDNTPTGVTNVWDVDTNSFVFTELTIGSVVNYRIDIEVTTTAVNQEFDLAMDLAVGGFPYTLNVLHTQYKTVGTYNIITSSFVYIGDVNTRDNLAKLKLSSSDDATVKINGWACSVSIY